MAKRNFLARLTGQSLPDLDQLASRRSAAEAAVAEAEQARGLAALDVEQGQDGASDRLAAAVQALSLAQGHLANLIAAQGAAQAARAKADLQTAAARRASDDRASVRAFEEWARKAADLQTILGGYVDAYEAYARAGETARQQAEANPRVRRDLLVQPVQNLVATELTRLASGRTLPPGGDRYAAAARDARQIVPLSDYFNRLTAAIREGLSHG